MNQFTPDVEALIRRVLNDTGAVKYTATQLRQVFDAVGGQEGLTIAHFLMYEVVTMAEPTAPTAPTFIEDRTLQKWNSDISVYRERLAYNRQLADYKMELARLWIDVAKGVVG